MYIAEPVTFDKHATESSATAEEESSTPPWEKDDSYLSSQPPEDADNSETLSEEDVEKVLVKHLGADTHHGDEHNTVSFASVTPFVSFAKVAPPVAYTMSRLTSTSATVHFRRLD